MAGKKVDSSVRKEKYNYKDESRLKMILVSKSKPISQILSQQLVEFFTGCRSLRSYNYLPIGWPTTTHKYFGI